jgi:hypothetical protein
MQQQDASSITSSGRAHRGRRYSGLSPLEDAGCSGHIVGYVGTIESLERILIESGGWQVKHDTTAG